MENYQFIHREHPEHINKNLNDMMTITIVYNNH
jgi:hypothetical protein